jgi:hypothetical protein
MEEGNSVARESPDARLIAAAIERGWILRGLKLGIGFWLSGVVIAGAAFVFVAVLFFGGLSMVSRTPDSPAEYSPPASSPPDSNWRATAKAYDEATEKNKKLFGAPKAPAR